MKMKKTISLLLAVILVLIAAIPAFAEEEIIRTTKPVITNSRFALLYEETTDTWMYMKDIDQKNAPASMTKVMTAVLVIENDPDLSGVATVSAKAISEHYCYWLDDFHLLEGEEVAVEDLMNYLLIASGNEAATVLAEYIAGDIDVFIQMMNDKAKEIGMKNTVYYDPHGLSDDSRVTCEDMLLLCRYAMQYEQFRNIVCKTTYVLPGTNMHSYHRIKNTNRVLRPEGVAEYKTGFEQDILGIKTGFITVAGNNLSCCMQHDDLKFYSVVMHARDQKNEDGEWREFHFVDTADLMKWARSFKKVGVAAGTEGISDVGTKLSMTKNVSYKVESDVYILAQDDVQPTYSFENLGWKVKEGDVIGTVTFSDEFGNERSANLIASADAKTSIRLFIGIMLLAVALAFSAGEIKRKKKK